MGGMPAFLSRHLLSWRRR